MMKLKLNNIYLLICFLFYFSFCYSQNKVSFFELKNTADSLLFIKSGNDSTGNSLNYQFGIYSAENKYVSDITIGLKQLVSDNPNELLFDVVIDNDSFEVLNYSYEYISGIHDSGGLIYTSGTPFDNGLLIPKDKFPLDSAIKIDRLMLCYKKLAIYFVLDIGFSWQVLLR